MYLLARACIYSSFLQCLKIKKNQFNAEFLSLEEDETKIDDVHSLVSGAGEYEPISDDELDEILAGDAEKREDQQEDEKMPGKI